MSGFRAPSMAIAEIKMRKSPTTKGMEAAICKTFSRRSVLGAALAAGILPILPGRARAASPAPKRLVAGTRMLEVNGRPAKVFGITGPDGRPGVRLAAGERFRVELANESGTRT